MTFATTNSRIAYTGCKTRKDFSIIPVTEGRKAVEALKAAGGNIKYTEYPDQDHDILEMTYTNP